MYYATPVVVVSECLGFSACRYNGDIIHHSLVARLADVARFIPVCPEVAIGLGVPRETVRLVKRGEEKRLVQPASNRDWTEEMKTFAREFLEMIGEVDGFIFKGRSPTCGIKEVKIYHEGDRAMPVEKGWECSRNRLFATFPMRLLKKKDV